MSPKRVAIIGGGASGIIALQQAVEHGLSPTLFEQRAQVGGAWIYSPDPGPCIVEFDSDGQATARTTTEHHGPTPATPMYHSLRTNVPTTLMQYRGAPFPSTTPLFATPADICSYLQTVAAPLASNIHLNTRVLRLRYTDPASRSSDLPQLERKWSIEHASVGADQNGDGHDAAVSTSEFDFVILANGHYAKSFFPLVPGLSSFEGTILHARFYRGPGPFKRTTVMVVGNSASGYDATREIAMAIHARRVADPHAELPKIYNSIRSPGALGISFDDPAAPEWAREIRLTPPITRVEGKTIYLADGSTVDDVDILLYATGYLFSYPFVHPTDAPFSSHPLTLTSPLPSGAPRTAPSEGGLRVHSLDSRDLFYLPDPTLAALCLPYLVIPFSLAQVQARLLSSFWSGRSKLDFTAGTPEEAPESRELLVYGHPRQFDYHDQLLAEMGEGGDGHGPWNKVSMAERDLRTGFKALRKAVLGY